MISLSNATAALVVILTIGPLPPTTLRVMTFNIHAGHGDLTRTAAVIRESHADVVALQEVDVHRGGTERVPGSGHGSGHRHGDGRSIRAHLPVARVPPRGTFPVSTAWRS